MAKPAPRPIRCDDCEITTDGVTSRPHEGETVWIVGSPTIRERRSFQSMLEYAISTRPEVNGNGHAPKPPTEAETEAARERSKEFDRRFDELCALLGECVVDWDWTNDRGKPLSKPDGTATPIHELHVEEVYYLWNAYGGRAEADRKNESNGSGTISGKTVRNRSRRS